jgi:hypothetical protein
MSPTSPSPPGLRGYLGRGNLLTSLVLVFPLFLVYSVAVVALPGVGNGADLITGRLYALLGRSSVNFLLFDLALAVIFGVVVLALRRRQRFDLRLFVPVLLESAVYALAMGAFVSWLISLLGIRPTLSIAAAAGPDRGGVLVRTALSIGAGVNEELVFRLLMLPALIALFHKIIGLGQWTAVALAFLADAALFSAAHHVIGGEPWALYPFMARLIMGLVFAALYQWRGFAVAVYTHFLYDFYVMVIHWA